MNEVIQNVMTRYDMIILMVALSLLIKIYKYATSKSTSRTIRGFFSTVGMDLLSDAIIILSLVIIDVYVISIHSGIMLLSICLSDSILNWFINNQKRLTSRLMKKIFDLIVDEIKLNTSTKQDKDEGEEISTE